MATGKTSLGFRKDINGLRAWAVIAVLLFHFKVPGFSAGFMGVDIFFVISGFLMTGIIARGLEKNNFSVWQFYMARFRRIVPAVAVLITVLLALGWFWLPTMYYKNLSEEALSSLSFLSNIYFWRSSGYFDSGAHEKWLLHTWSLGIEMQFYLLFPIFAVIIWKLKPSLKIFFYSLVVIGLGSLALSIVASSWTATAAFYLLPTRGWELAAGGIVYFLSYKEFTAKQQQSFYLAGFALWLVGFFVIDANLAWPSGWALLPVVGTAFIILAAKNNSWLTHNSLAQWLGKNSYSVYLWHWPLVVGLYFAGLQTNWLWITGFFILSIILGELSYRLIENPTRKGLIKLSFAKQFTGFAVMALVIGVCAISIKHFEFNRGLPAELEIAASEINNINYKVRERCNYKRHSNTIKGCKFGGESITAALFGDSHSEAIASALAEAGQNYNQGYIYLAGAHGCPALKGIDRKRTRSICSNYFDLVDKKLRELNQEVKLIIVTSNWLQIFDAPEEYSAELENTVCSITEEGREVYLMRNIPGMKDRVPITVMRNILMGNAENEVYTPLKGYLEKNKEFHKAQNYVANKCGAKILDTTKHLCDDKKCYGSNNGRPMFYDAGHISEYGNRFLVPMFEEVFKDSE